VGGSIQVPSLDQLRVQIFADGADLKGIVEMARQPYIKGFTTNPTLMRKAGVADYRAFARDVLQAVPNRPISFEVFADDFGEMERQAREIATWGECVFVKIPVTDTHGRSAAPLIARLAADRIQLNVTALLTLEQVQAVSAALADDAPSFISVFAGRLADSGRDPLPLLAQALEAMKKAPRQRLIWASPREVLNILQADAVGCHVITVTNELLQKLPLVGKDPLQFSLETVRMFHDDAKKAGYTL
jgi:transaldolase